jgi:phosphatidylglycerol:prolipoprotein diacylglycerol transferase
MIGPFVHNIDPIVAKIGVFYIWWYGISFTAGFLGIFFWLRRNLSTLAMNMHEVYALSIYMASGVLIGGRLVEVIFYEWPYYGSHLWHILAVWLGGMSTHGILLGSILGLLIYCKKRKRSFLEIADVLAIAGAYIMGVGRIGNFIDGQIVGSITDGWWGVKFPDVEGYRHPVVLYDGIKNLLLIPFLLIIRKTKPPRGVIMAHFILWYGFLRIFVDFYREYRTEFYGFPPGQEFNLFMTFVGVGLLFWFYRKTKSATVPTMHFTSSNTISSAPLSGLWKKRVTFALLLILPTIIPGDWTHDVPKRYGHRHPGLDYSIIYPKVDVYNETKPAEKSENNKINTD